MNWGDIISKMEKINNMKATKEGACELVSEYFNIELSEIKNKIYYKVKNHFDAVEMIAKGRAIIDVQTRPALSDNQKKELIKYIKEL